MKIGILLSAAAMIVAPAIVLAQGGLPDPRAVAFCDSIAATVPVDECLPDAHVAVLTLDTFDALYPSAAQALRTFCSAKNKSPNSEALCVITAIETAVTRGQAGEPLDPILRMLTDPAQLAELEAVQLRERALFPERTLWGGGMYMAYE